VRQLNSQAEDLLKTDRKLNELITQSAIKDEQIANLNKEAALKTKQLSSQRAELEAKESQLTRLLGILSKIDEEIRIKYEELLVKDNKISTLSTKISGLETKLSQKEEESRVDNIQLQAKNAIIAQKTQEISDIYNSDAFRIFVRPVIWPLFSFIKRICLRPKSKPYPQGQIKITRFIADNMNAKIGAENGYLVKIFNKGFKEAGGTLVIDIWPYSSPAHPQRHYAYFTAEFSLSPRSSAEFRVNYDWRNLAQITSSGKKAEIKHFWLGPKIPDDFYRVDAYIRNPENQIIDSLKILQKLSR
ncbi:MAG: hypothetical protein WC417_05060, partial [Candidatus Omnitrophota bacterium]